MKKVIVLILACVIFTGCVTPAVEGKIEGAVSQIPLAVKDFYIIDIVTVRTTGVLSADGLYLTSGSKPTYEALLVEARNLGADDIANLRIDERRDRSVTRTQDGQTTTRNTVEYTATALAIKYITASE